MKVNPGLTLARLVGLSAAVGAGLTAFSGAVTTNGNYKAATVAGLSAVVAVWMHEEHSTERNATSAAASLSAPAPLDPHAAGLVADATAAMHGLEHILGGGGPAPAPQAAPGPHSAQPGPGTPA